MTIKKLKQSLPNSSELFAGASLEATLGSAIARAQEDPYDVDSALREAFCREYDALNERDYFTGLLMWYARADADERSVIDNVLWRICGSTLARIAWLAMHSDEVERLLDY